MSSNCKRLTHALGAAEALGEDLQGHLAGCPDCQTRQAGFARLDALLADEPPVPAPLGFAARVRATLIANRRRELVLARRQTAALVAAAVLLGAVLLPLAGFLPSADEAAGVDLSGELSARFASGFAEIRESILVFTNAASAWGTVSGAAEPLAQLPAPPLLLVLLLAPLFLLANYALTREVDPHPALSLGLRPGRS